MAIGRPSFPRLRGTPPQASGSACAPHSCGLLDRNSRRSARLSPLDLGRTSISSGILNSQNRDHLERPSGNFRPGHFFPKFFCARFYNLFTFHLTNLPSNPASSSPLGNDGAAPLAAGWIADPSPYDSFIH